MIPTKKKRNDKENLKYCERNYIVIRVFEQKTFSPSKTQCFEVLHRKTF